MPQTQKNNFIEIVARTLNFVDPRLVDHGKRVGVILSEMLSDYPKELVGKLCVTALIHDIGAYRTEEIDRIVAFETHDVWEHSIYGSLILQEFPPFDKLAETVLYHHADRAARKNLDPETAFLSQVLHAADRADIFLAHTERPDKELLEQLYHSDLFDHKVISLLEDAMKRHDLRSYSRDYPLQELISQMILSEADALSYIRMIVFLIDFRSRFTVTHTMAVAVIAAELGRKCKLSAREQKEIEYGALLHDLGKISTPVEILESPGKLNDQQMEIMRQHVVVTGRILDGCISETIRQIAVRHHEKMDGSGYPLGLNGKDLSLSERIVAVADVTSALYGARSYKAAFSSEKVVRILKDMADNGALDPELVQILCANFGEFAGQIDKSNERLLKMYDRVHQGYKNLLFQFKENTNMKENDL